MMRIEVAALVDAPGASKQKGDLLQDFAHEFATTQGLRVVKELRTASSEIDLHCENRSTGETIYIECKAHRDPLSKTALTNLMGVVEGDDYTQGWLISTGPLSKDAKGYQLNWEKKPLPQRAKLRVLAENDLARALVDAKLVKDPTNVLLPEATKDGHDASTWVLLITEYGRFWTTPKFQGGIAAEVYVLGASNLEPIEDKELLARLSKVDSSWTGKTFITHSSQSWSLSSNREVPAVPPVVEVLEGRKWSDYLPTRLKDFVGRKRELAEIFDLIESVRLGRSNQHVFAITGESGIGKSSVITSIRGRTRQRNNRKKIFSLAVDCRAASSKDYITAALLRGLTKAREAGFGAAGDVEFQISNPSHPLSSPTIAKFTQSLRDRQQVVCIMFDQFEEIYAKPELKEVFVAAHELFLSAVSDAGPIVLGFAWRSNFAVQQDHPAYYMWHRLADYRLEFPLKPLEPGEVNSALTAFEKELGEKLSVEARRQLVEAARGYPWLLKKLCIHLLQQVRIQSVDQLAVENLSVKSLFSKDLQGISDLEGRSLKFIAQQAPVAAYEVVENFGEAPLRALEEQLLVTRSGEMLNIYWDIFKDFILNGTVPDLPFSFLPASASIASLLSVADQLRSGVGRSHEEIAKPTQLAVGTVGNIVRDLLIIGVAVGTYARPELSATLEPSDPKGVMRQVRSALGKHTLLRQLKNTREEGNFTEDEICRALAEIPSVPEYEEKNLQGHVRRLCSWFAAAGYIQATAQGWRITDIGDVDLSYSQQRRSKATGPFNGGATPPRVLEVLNIVKERSSVDPSQLKSAGFEKALNTLSRFGLIVKLERSWSYVAAESSEIGLSPLSRLHEAARKQSSLVEAVRFLRVDRSVSGPILAKHLASHFGEDWSEGSLKRTGNALKRWASWLIECEDHGTVVEPSAGVRGKKSMKTPERMQRIHELLEQGATKKAVAAEIGVSVGTIHNWLSTEKGND